MLACVAFGPRVRVGFTFARGLGRGRDLGLGLGQLSGLLLGLASVFVFGLGRPCSTLYPSWERFLAFVLVWFAVGGLGKVSAWPLGFSQQDTFEKNEAT